MSQTIPVRSGEELDLEIVKKYILSNIDGVPDEEINVRQFPAGRSNLTYTIQMGNWEAVLRRPPFGPLPLKAHDMEREYTVLNKLFPVFPLVPKPFIFCHDKDVIGAPFYIMERVKGMTVDVDTEENEKMTLEDRKHLSHLMVDAIVKLHKVDYKKVGLENIGYPEQFLERQLKNWIFRYQKAKVDEIELVDKIIKWLNDNIPQSQAPTLIHNDFKINNVLLSYGYKKINAILDWEMATIGDPLFDLGTTISYWLEEKDPDFVKDSLGQPSAQPGFISRREFLESYAIKTGRDVSSFQFYFVFAYFKIAVAVQQMYFRYHSGQTNDQRFAETNIRAKNLMTYAEMLTHEKI